MQNLRENFVRIGVPMLFAACGASETKPATVPTPPEAINASQGALCTDFGPQTPRDISNTAGKNPNGAPLAPPATELNLCNIHMHTNAEHKGPEFSVFAGNQKHGGYRCNDTDSLTASERKDPANGNGAFQGIVPGDTIEVHWVHTSCDITPGPGLGSCMTESCQDPQLRVEAQVFLVVNDPNALDFADMAYSAPASGGRHQAKSLPSAENSVVFAGSTTGPSYTQQKCSPLQVTWSVRPTCTKIDVNSLYKWAGEGNVFEETQSHGVRSLVTAPELLSEI